MTGAIARRGLAYFALWVALIGVAPADLAVGVVAAAIATAASLRLLPPGGSTWRWGPALAALPYFLGKSVIASVDIARRALAPTVDVNPGFVSYAPRAPSGETRNAFSTITSLMPGTLPCAEEDGRIVYHCLDAGADVAADLARDEARFAAITGEVRA